MSELVNCASAGKMALDRAMRVWRLGHRHDEIYLWLGRAAAAFAQRFEPATLSQEGASGPTAHDALLALQLMAIVGEEPALQQLATRVEAIFSPENTSHETALALAFAALSRGKDAVAIFHTAEIRGDRMRQQADAVCALVERDTAAIAAIQDAPHEAQPDTGVDAGTVMPLPALACQSLALRRSASR